MRHTQVRLAEMQERSLAFGKKRLAKVERIQQDRRDLELVSERAHFWRPFSDGSFGATFRVTFACIEGEFRSFFRRVSLIWAHNWELLVKNRRDLLIWVLIIAKFGDKAFVFCCFGC